MTASAIDSPALGVSSLERGNELFASRFSRDGSASPSHADFFLNDPLPGGATPANHLQAAPASSGDIAGAAAPAPQTFVGNAAVSGPQLYDNLEQNPLESFVLQSNQRSTGGIPGDSVGPTSSGGAGTAVGGGGGAAAPGGGATCRHSNRFAGRFSFRSAWRRRVRFAAPQSNRLHNFGRLASPAYCVEPDLFGKHGEPCAPCEHVLKPRCRARPDGSDVGDFKLRGSLDVAWRPTAYHSGLHDGPRAGSVREFRQ
jgi:hypothetical protein